MSDDGVPMPEGTRVFMLGPKLALLEMPIPEARRLESLTPAEQEVALAVFEGATNQEIAAARGVSVKTIGNQLETIYRKAGVACRAELILAIRSAAALDE